MLCILPVMSTNTSTQRNACELAHTDTHREKKKSRTGKINILVLTLHLVLSVMPIEEKTETDRVNVKTESLKVQM